MVGGEVVTVGGIITFPEEDDDDELIEPDDEDDDGLIEPDDEDDDELIEPDDEVLEEEVLEEEVLEVQLILPILFPVLSTNQRLLSGPLVISYG